MMIHTRTLGLAIFILLLHMIFTPAAHAATDPHEIIKSTTKQYNYGSDTIKNNRVQRGRAHRENRQMRRARNEQMNTYDDRTQSQDKLSSTNTRQNQRNGRTARNKNSRVEARAYDALTQKLNGLKVNGLND